jgi:hypothetical protein
MDGDPDIQVIRGAWIPMIPHRVPTNEKIFNAMRVEQSQELFEVGR